MWRVNLWFFADIGLTKKCSSKQKKNNFHRIWIALKTVEISALKRLYFWIFIYLIYIITSLIKNSQLTLSRILYPNLTYRAAFFHTIVWPFFICIYIKAQPLRLYHWTTFRPGGTILFASITRLSSHLAINYATTQPHHHLHISRSYVYIYMWPSALTRPQFDTFISLVRFIHTESQLSVRLINKFLWANVVASTLTHTKRNSSFTLVAAETIFAIYKKDNIRLMICVLYYVYN